MATSNRWLAVPQLLFVVSLAAATSCSGSAEQSDEPLAATPELCAVASDYAMSSESRREGFPVDPPDPGVYLQELARTSSGSLHQDIQDLIKLYEKSGSPDPGVGG